MSKDQSKLYFSIHDTFKMFRVIFNTLLYGILGVYTGASSLLVKVKRGHPVSMILSMSLSLFLWKCMVKVCIFLWVVAKILQYGFIGIFDGLYCAAEEFLMCSGLLLVVCFSWTQIK